MLKYPNAEIGVVDVTVPVESNVEENEMPENNIEPLEVSLNQKIDELEESIADNLKQLEEIKNGELCLPFFGMDIIPPVVDDVFDELRTKSKEHDGRLSIILDSYGGNIDAAYNLAMLFRKYGETKLEFIVPRWAKSAATLLACSGDIILMSPIAELGPLDPQFTSSNPREKRFERFSPLHIESTLDMIRTEFEEGSEKLASALMERLQFPLTLGRFIKSLEVSEQYLAKLLNTRMFQAAEETDKADTIARRLAREYADHGFCINIDEAKSIGLKVDELAGKELDLIWKIYRLNEKRQGLQEVLNEKKIMELVKNLPPEILKNLPESSQGNPETEKPQEKSNEL